MSKEEFDEVFKKLTFMQQQVLIKLLAGKTNRQIAESLRIEQYAVRKNVENICDAFNIEQASPGERRPRRPQLFPLVYKCKPELLGGQIPKPLTQKDPNFVGREGAIDKLNNIVSQGAKVILIQAKGGVGKTKLAWEYLKGFDLVLELWMAKETQNITSAASVIEEWLRRYFEEEPGREFGITLERLKQQLRNQTKRIGVLIDNLEPALDGNGKLIAAHRPYVELLRVLVDPAVQSVTLITSRDRLRESDVTVWHYPLEGLAVEAWQQFFNSRQIQTDSPVLSAMHNAYGGNAKAMEILSGALQVDYEGNLEAYWQANQGDLLIEGDLRDLVTSQFTRLQQLDPDAYRLLCRLGCYRYQDVPSVPSEGLLCLLWDVPEAQRRRVINSLRDRSLVEFHNGEYWLHPVIRAEAISRSRASEDWETANRTAAEFWTESVKTVESVEDALRAFEAYYHYLEINDFEQAGKVITRKRHSSREKRGALGRAFYRMGLSQQIISGISCIVDRINPGQPLCELYSILGDIYWLTGNTHKAIDFQEKTREVAVQTNKLWHQVFSLLNIGACKVDLWEIKEAVIIFQKVESLARTRIEFHKYAVSALSYLAFLNSCLGFEKRATELAEQTCNEILTANMSTWSKGYALTFLGFTYKKLGNLEKSFEMHNQAITYAKESHYTQVKAKALYGLAELYREKRDFETAISNHLEAIDLLDKIGVKPDLAQAYYELGLTYQKMGEVEDSRTEFQKAIQLFNQMEAPKQVEKVRRAMESGGGECPLR